jgi:hypothetical protein
MDYILKRGISGEGGGLNVPFLPRYGFRWKKVEERVKMRLGINRSNPESSKPCLKW